MSSFVIAMSGMAGSGKTTLSRRLASDHSTILIEGGAIARDLALRDEETRVALSEGRIAPPQKMEEAMKVALTNAKIAVDLNIGNVIIDGYPRYQSQVDTFLSTFDMNRVIAVRLNCNEAIAKQRLLGRGRADDTESNIASRHWFYCHQTMPAFDEIMKKAKNRMVIPMMHQDEMLQYFHHEFRRILKAETPL